MNYTRLTGSFPLPDPQFSLFSITIQLCMLLINERLVAGHSWLCINMILN